jgi:hypothetical protein
MPPKGHKKRKPKSKAGAGKGGKAGGSAPSSASGVPVADTAASERYKQLGNDAFKARDFATAVRCPELPFPNTSAATS